MRKTITILLTAVVLLSVICMIPTAKAAGNYTIRLAGADGSNVVSAKPGETVKLILSLENNPGILSVGVEVSYSSGLSITAQPNDVSGFSSVATVYKTFSPQLSSNPYLLWWNMPLGDSSKRLVTKEGNIAEITFKVASNAQSGDYNITLTAPQDKNLTASVSGGVIVPDSNTNVTDISLAGCTIRVENLCAQGHNYGAWKNDGNGKHSRTCSVCGTPETKEHTWDSGTVTKQPTCKEAGVKTYACTTQGCGATTTENIDKTNHNYGAWVDAGNGKHSRTCSACSAKDDVAHTWNEGIVTEQPSCKDEGIATYLCTDCGSKKTEPVAKTDEHTYDNTCDADCNVCGETHIIAHQYGKDWRKNKDAHWHQCTVCGNKKDETKHVPGAEATRTEPQKCKTCDYIIKPALLHECQYGDTWTTDEAGHWYACDNCEEQGDYAAHDFENPCDPDCSICGYVRQTSHVYTTEWTSDASGHWHSCTHCDDKAELAEHQVGAAADETKAQTCCICGYGLESLQGETELGNTDDSSAPSKEGGNTSKIVLWVLFVVFVAGAVSVATLLIIKNKR